MYEELRQIIALRVSIMQVLPWIVIAVAQLCERQVVNSRREDMKYYENITDWVRKVRW